MSSKSICSIFVTSAFISILSLACGQSNLGIESGSTQCSSKDNVARVEKLENDLKQLKASSEANLKELEAMSKDVLNNYKVMMEYDVNQLNPVLKVDLKQLKDKLTDLLEKSNGLINNTRRSADSSTDMKLEARIDKLKDDMKQLHAMCDVVSKWNAMLHVEMNKLANMFVGLLEKSNGQVNDLRRLRN